VKWFRRKRYTEADWVTVDPTVPAAVVKEIRYLLLNQIVVWSCSAHCMTDGGPHDERCTTSPRLSPELAAWLAIPDYSRPWEAKLDGGHVMPPPPSIAVMTYVNEADLVAALQGHLIPRGALMMIIGNERKGQP
jgi:hypothetical protein